MRIKCLHHESGAMAPFAPAQLPPDPSPHRRHRPRNRADPPGLRSAQGRASGPERTTQAMRVTHIQLASPSRSRPGRMQWPYGHLRTPQPDGRSRPHRPTSQGRILQKGHRTVDGPWRHPASAGNLRRPGLRPGPRVRSPAQCPAHLRQRGRALWIMAAKPASQAASCLQSRPRQRLHPASDSPLRRTSGATRGRR